MAGALIKKLQIKTGQRIAFVSPPPGYVEGLGPLPPATEVVTELESPLDFIQVFVRNRTELEGVIPTALRALKNDALLWVCYPKGSAKVATDLNRDILWEKMSKFGLAGVSLVSLDNVWSAMRFRPTEKVGKKSKVSD